MNINLPDLPWQEHNWSEAGQIEKIREEFNEVVEAHINCDPINLVREALDLMQTAVTLINMQVDEYGMDINKFLAEHNEKLQRKGYLKNKWDTLAEAMDEMEANEDGCKSR